jgi:hypothetical protein
LPYNNINLLALEILRFKSMSLDEREKMGQRARKFLFENRLFSKLANDYSELFV